MRDFSRLRLGGVPLTLHQRMGLQWKTHPVLKSHLFDFGVQNLLVEQTSEHTWDALGRSFSTIWDALKRFWTISGTLGALLGHSRVPLGPFWGAFWDAPGCSWTPLGRNVRKDGLVSVFRSPIWSPFGDLLAPKRFQNQVDKNSAFSTHFLSLFSLFPRFTP